MANYIYKFSDPSGIFIFCPLTPRLAARLTLAGFRLGGHVTASRLRPALRQRADHESQR